MALNREAKVMQRIEEICKGVAEKSVEMQWHGIDMTRYGKK